MPVLKKAVRQDFTVVHNTFLRDEQLSIAARGILITMISMPSDWNFSIRGFEAILPDGERKISAALKELEKHGYLRRIRKTDERGMFAGWDYAFSDDPEDVSNYFRDMEEKKHPYRRFADLDNPDVENPDVGNPDPDNPDLENSVQSNTIKSSTIQSNIHESISQSEGNKTFNNLSTVETVENDRQTDGFQQTEGSMSYAEMLAAINSPLASEHITSEDDLADYDEGIRQVRSCTIPHWIQQDGQAFTAAMKYLIAYSYHMPNNDDEIRWFCDTVILCLTEMVTSGRCGKMVVKYYQIIDNLNELVHRGELIDWMYDYFDTWKKNLKKKQEEGDPVRNKKAYLKTCIYNELQGEYKIRGIYPDPH